MSDQARIIVVGGGIVGCSILYHLAKAGCADALLLERAELTSGATWHAAGNTHTQSAIPNLSKLQAYSLELYAGLAAEVGQEVGAHRCGGFFLAQSAERMTEFKFLVGKFRGLGIDYDLATPSEIAAKHPLVNTDGLVGGLWDPDEGYVDPYSVTMGLAAGARRNGARIERNRLVMKIERRADGWRVSTRDHSYYCEIVVNAAGFWADEVARMVGARLPITNMEHHYLVTETVPEVAARQDELPMIRDTDWGFYMRQEGDGLLAGPWEQNCRAAWGGEPAPWDFGQELFQPDFDRLESDLERICARVPAFAAAGIKRTVNGAISFAPDARPLLGPLPGVPGYFVACGFLGGIAQGGGAGLALSQWILEGEPELDLAPIDVARFGDWASKDFARARTYEVFPRRYEIIYPQLERESGRGLRKTPIHARLEARGAVFGQAYGWERPLWFAPEGVAAKDEPSFSRPNWHDHVGAECRAVSERVGLVEMSSYAKFEISGPDAARFLDGLASNRLPSEPGRMVLTLLLNGRGGIVGDLTLCRLAGDRFYAVGATAAEGIYRRWLDRHARGHDVTVRAVTADWAVLGVTGPKARGLLQSLTSSDLSPAAFRFMTQQDIDVGPVACRALRLSYAGELGWELHCPMTDQLALFEALTVAGEAFGLALVGAQAMGSLRLEKGYRSWGSELNTEFTPAVAGLERFCRPDKGDFTGRAAVLAEQETPPPQALATLAVDAEGADCWGQEPIFDAGAVVGYVTSGGYGWRVDKSLAVGWIPRGLADPGTELQVEILGARYPARVLADPVYDPNNARLLG